MDMMSAVEPASPDRVKEEVNDLVYNYKKLRAAIGYLGLSLPFTTWLGSWLVFHTKLQGSISGYYYTGMRDVFVGTMWATGFFLVAYKGYNKKEDWLGNLACLFAVLLSIFPTYNPLINSSLTANRIGYIHTGSAACFFAILAYFAFQFTASDQPLDQQTPQKRRRNMVYKVCGTLMAVSLVLIIVTAILPATAIARLAVLRPLYVLETVAILSFSISWLVKGEAIMGDQIETVGSVSPSAGNI